MAIKKAKATLIALVAVAMALAVATSGALSLSSSSQKVPSGGTLTQLEGSVNLEIYANSQCTQEASFVDWGALEPGANATKTVWVKNVGSTTLELSLAATSWTPQNAYPSISLTWNQEGRHLSPSEVVQATLTLRVSANIDSSISQFNFDIQITGTG